MSDEAVKEVALHERSIPRKVISRICDIIIETGKGNLSLTDVQGYYTKYIEERAISRRPRPNIKDLEAKQNLADSKPKRTAVFQDIINKLSPIEKGIILGFIPIFAASVLMVLLQGTMTALRLRFFYFFAAFFLLTFFSILIYAMSKVSRKQGVSYGRSIALFFIGVVIFIGGMGLVDFLFGFLNPELGMLQSLLRGIRSGLMLGSGVSIVVLLLSQRKT